MLSSDRNDRCVKGGIRKRIRIRNGSGEQRKKNLGSRVALLPGKFLRVRKVFARINEKTF